MFTREDNTYNDIREKSVMQWLDEMEVHHELEVKGGVRVTRDYIADLKKQIEILKEQGALKDRYLKQMKAKAKG